MRQYENPEYDPWEDVPPEHDAPTSREQSDYHVNDIFDGRYGVSIFAPDDQEPPF